MLGDRIKEARKAKKLSQRQLAALIDVKHNSICDWEKNRHSPDINLLPKLCEVLDVKANWLLEDGDKPVNTNVRNFLTSDIEELPQEAKNEIDNFIEFIKSKYNPRRN